MNNCTEENNQLNLSIYYLRSRVSVVSLVHFEIPSITDLPPSLSKLFLLFRINKLFKKHCMHEIDLSAYYLRSRDIAVSWVHLEISSKRDLPPLSFIMFQLSKVKNLINWAWRIAWKGETNRNECHLRLRVSVVSLVHFWIPFTTDLQPSLPMMLSLCRL